MRELGAARRKPSLLLRLSGSFQFLLRIAERQFLAVLFQLPPRYTRFAARYGLHPGLISTFFE